MTSGVYEIVRGNDALVLSDLANLAVLEQDGFGMAPLHRITERGPLQHGESDRGYRLDPRMIQMVLNLRATDWAAHYALRQALIEYLSPTEAISLRHTQPDGTVRQVDCYCAAGPEFASGDRSGRFQFQRAAVRLYCPDPAWYDPTRQSVRVVGGGGGTGFLFPGAVPWTFGGLDIDTDAVIPYAGTWLEYPEIVIYGPIDNARIENTETGDVLEFSGTIDSGDYYVLDLRYGYKTVVDAGGVNKIGDLTAASDLATWHLQPGDNTINFSGANASSVTALVVRWYNRYLGV